MVGYMPTTKCKIRNNDHGTKGSKDSEGELTTNMVRKDPTRDMTSPEKAQQPLKQSQKQNRKKIKGLGRKM